jgi:hypothetical protein
VAFWAAVQDVKEAQAKVYKAEEDEDVPNVFDQAAHVEKSGLNLVQGQVVTVTVPKRADLHNIGYITPDI